MTNFVLIHQSIIDRDAIGQDIFEMYKLLGQKHAAHLYCQYFQGADGCKRIDFASLSTLIQNPETVLIYHHSNYWEEGENVLLNARCRIVIKYHNVTPPDFFRGIPEYFGGCLRGREQTYRLARVLPGALWMSDSNYNLLELGLRRISPSAIVPPFPDPSSATHTKPDLETLKTLIEDSSLNIFFIGRVAPNKGHLLLARVLASYRDLYGEKIRLSVFGKLDQNNKSYFDNFLDRIKLAGVEHLFNWGAAVSDEVRLAYYLGAGAYVCCSDHEGFCVPIVEAQACKLPVVAKDSGAVSETLGPGQLLLRDDPVEFAHVLHRIATDNRYRENIVNRGHNNYTQRFQYRVVRQLFLSSMQNFLGYEL